MIGQKFLQTRSDLFKSQNPELSTFDVVFDVGGKKIYAHKFMLESISTTFSSMISDRWTSKDVPIPLDTYTYDDFYDFLLVLYSGECNFTNDNIFTMVDIAEFYQVSDLKNECEEFLTKLKCNFDNIIQLIEVASKYSLDNLKKSIAPFIKSNALKIFQCDPPLQISKENVSEIFRMCKFDYRAEEFFEKVYEWAEKQAMTKMELNSNLNVDETIKEILADYMPIFNFAKMDHCFVIKYLVAKSLFPHGQELSEILLNSFKNSTTTVNVKIIDANGRIMKGKFYDPGNVYDEIQKLRNVPCMHNGHNYFHWNTSCKGCPPQKTLRLSSEVEWYLIYDEDKDLAVKRRFQINGRFDTLIAEMFADDGFVMSSGCRIEAFLS